MKAISDKTADILFWEIEKNHSISRNDFNEY